MFDDIEFEGYKGKVLTKKTYPIYFKMMMDRKERVLEKFKALLKEDGIDESVFDLSPDSLIPIFEAVVKRCYISQEEYNRIYKPLPDIYSELPLCKLYVSPRPDYDILVEDKPIWINIYDVDRFGLFSDMGVSLDFLPYLDGLSYYYGDVLVKNLEHFHWSPKPERFHRHGYVSGPYVRRDRYPKFGPNPIGEVGSCISRYFRKKCDKDELYQRYFFWQKKNKGPFAPPPKSEFEDSHPKIAKKLKEADEYLDYETLVSVENIPKDEQSEIDGVLCNKVISIYAGFESIFGKEMYEKLEEMIQSIDKVKFVAQTDREIFEAKSSMGKKRLMMAVIDEIEKRL